MKSRNGSWIYELIAIICFVGLLFCVSCSDNTNDTDGIGLDGDAEDELSDTSLSQGDDDALEMENEEDRSPFLFAVVSDTHLMLTNDSLTNQAFILFAKRFKELEPKAEFVVSTGDNIEDLLCFPDLSCVDPLPVLTNYRQLIEDHFDVPFYAVLGNHDNRYFDQFLDTETPWASWQFVFGDTSVIPDKYYAVEYKGFLLLMLNATDLAFDHDSNDEATFGPEQLSWLEEQLQRGLPSILFWHHCMTPPSEGQEEISPIFPVIETYRENVKAVFTGHLHHFSHDQWKGVDFYQTDNLGKNEEGVTPYHLVHCDPQTGIVTIANDADIEYASSN